MDSAYYNAAVIGAVRRGGARFSVTAPMNRSIRAAIAAIPEDAWTPIRYPQAIWDDQLGCWVSDAEVAEDPVHRVRVEEGPGRHRPADRPPGPRPEQEGRRRAGRAVPRLALPRRLHRLPVRAGPGRGAAPRPRDRGAGLRRRHQRPARSPALRGLSPRTPPGCPSRRWRTTCSAPPAPWPASPSRKPAAATIRRDLIAVAARTARHGRGHLTLHLPEGWHREHEWLNLFGRRLRAARRSGLTSPDPVTHPDGPAATRTPPPSPGTQDKPHSRRAAGRPRPKSPRETPRAGIKPETSYRNWPVDRGLAQPGEAGDAPGPVIVTEYVEHPAIDHGLDSEAEVECVGDFEPGGQPEPWTLCAPAASIWDGREPRSTGAASERVMGWRATAGFLHGGVAECMCVKMRPR